MDTDLDHDSAPSEDELEDSGLAASRPVSREEDAHTTRDAPGARLDFVRMLKARNARTHVCMHCDR